jgi:hypothetical protein
MQPPRIEPDTRDWTFTITDGCAECGFDPGYDVTTTGTRMRNAAKGLVEALRRTDATRRPSAQVWSPLEYGCHVRDVFRIFGERLALMLAEDDPRFADWDQDRTAVEDRYWEQDPTTVADELTEVAAVTSAAFDAVEGDAWQRPGRRSNGSVFTVGRLAVYCLHDVEHHVHDVQR